MELLLNIKVAEKYKNNSQRARVLTEDWVNRNAFCPKCGKEKICKFENNRPVADFYCDNCKEEYELKSKKGVFSNIINDGAYTTMIERITSNANPDFFFITYNIDKYIVNNFLIIPKHFFTPSIINKRKPLAQTARRAGWIGCNIDLKAIPSDGKIYIIENGKEVPKETVIKKMNKNLFLNEEKIINRGWLLDIMRCIDKIDKEMFTLKEMYKFKEYLQMLHPNNNNIEAKIRQQLQILRNNNYIEFCGDGKYRRNCYEY